nr:uncharacterized protein LOC110375574 [Helicoverpa armigera]
MSYRVDGYSARHTDGCERLVCMSSHTMLAVGLALLQAAACLDVRVEGDLALELHLANESRGRPRWFRVGWEAPASQAHDLKLKLLQTNLNMTAAPEVECLYQYPEKEQVNALLSNMMNELTKVFVRANDFINGVETRRKGESQQGEDSSKGDSHEEEDSSKGHYKGEKLKKYSKKEVTPDMKKGAKKGGKKDIIKNDESKENETSAVTRAGDRRFKVVHKKQKEFFELIYTNMTEEYRKFSAWAAERVQRAGRDACAHQDEVKQLWRELLAHALRTLGAAARRTVAAQLRARPHAPGLRARLDQFLEHDLGKVRAAQLGMLCDTYQLCYNDLL